MQNAKNKDLTPKLLMQNAKNKDLTPKLLAIYRSPFTAPLTLGQFLTS